MKTIKLSEACELMVKCIRSCTSEEQLDMTIDWIESVIVPNRFKEHDPEFVINAKGELFELIRIRGQKLFGIGDDEEIDIKANTIHHQ